MLNKNQQNLVHFSSKCYQIGWRTSENVAYCSCINRVSRRWSRRCRRRGRRRCRGSGRRQAARRSLAAARGLPQQQIPKSPAEGPR